MKRNETSQQTIHFDTTPRRASDPRAIILMLMGALIGVCIAVVFIVPWVVR